jgi:hypothetical protein
VPGRGLTRYHVSRVHLNFREMKCLRPGVKGEKILRSPRRQGFRLSYISLRDLSLPHGTESVEVRNATIGLIKLADLGLPLPFYLPWSAWLHRLALSRTDFEGQTSTPFPSTGIKRTFSSRTPFSLALRLLATRVKFIIIASNTSFCQYRGAIPLRWQYAANRDHNGYNGSVSSSASIPHTYES